MAKALSKTALIGGTERRPITIADYDPEWPIKFETHRGIIAGALGDAAQQIEHVGSTSVPGLAAKPIVDILVAVKDSGDESCYLPNLTAAGYFLRIREPDWHEHRMFRTLGKDVHIHVYSVGCAEIGRCLGFRDRLRTNVEDRRRYEALKRELAEKDWPDMNAYADAKSEMIEGIVRSARLRE